jgi:hypothetical protein
MAKTITLRLDDAQACTLELVKEYTKEATASKAILRALNDYLELNATIDAHENHIEDLEILVKFLKRALEGEGS